MMEVAPQLEEEGEPEGGEQTGIHAWATQEVVSSLWPISHWLEFSHVAIPSCKEGWEM